MTREGFSALAYVESVPLSSLGYVTLAPRRSETICDLINVNWLAWVFCTVVAASATGVTTALLEAMPELSTFAKVRAQSHCRATRGATPATYMVTSMVDGSMDAWDSRRFSTVYSAHCPRKKSLHHSR